MRLPTLILPLTVGLLAAAAAPAGAATIAYEHDAVVFRAGPGERNTLYLYAPYPERAGAVRFTDSGAAAWSVPEGCVAVDDSTVDCEIPGRIRVELGDGDDTLGYSETFLEAVSVEAFGGDGDDSLRGNHSADVAELLDGGAGKDFLDGYGADDRLDGGPGDDTVKGNAGNDVVRGGDGDDELTGDDQATPGNDVIDGGAGSDRVAEYVEYATDVHPAAGVSLDGIANDGRPGEADNVTGVERYRAYVSGRFVLTNAAEEWEVWSNMNSGASEVLALGGDDRVIGEDASETIDGGAGNDYVEGGKGHDTLKGGPGKDVVFGDDTDNTCNAAYPESCVLYGNDVIDTRDGEADQVDCGAGADRALVDGLDTVAANCETIERGAGPTPPGHTPGPGPLPRPRVATLKLGGGKLGAVLAKGLLVRVAKAVPGARKITVTYGRRTVGGGRVTVKADGTVTARVRFSRTGRRTLKRVRKAKLVVSGAGARAAITLRR